MIKNYFQFINEQFDDFYDDYKDSQKKIKLFTKFTSSNLQHKEKGIKVDMPKRKFQPKVRIMKKKSDKGIF